MKMKISDCPLTIFSLLAHCSKEAQKNNSMRPGICKVNSFKTYSEREKLKENVCE
jgi:hypothetical protein